MEKKRKIILLVIAIILSITATINLSVSLYAKEEKTYKIELEDGAIINNLYIDDHKQDLEQLEDDDLKYREKNNGFLEVIEDTTISINISKISDISISFEDKSKVNIKEDGISQKINNSDVFYDNVPILTVIEKSISLVSIVYFLIFFISEVSEKLLPEISIFLKPASYKLFIISILFTFIFWMFNPLYLLSIILWAFATNSSSGIFSASILCMSLETGGA